ncbi:MAG TPA: Ca2+-dependent phosphoinositide-specific phospholipase C, partial [Acidimicrobiales bacterium]|nr:Ca2+-dependent phosphoinositide-specific phospholipase C [Acidimicrobiales bacterium]
MRSALALALSVALLAASPALAQPASSPQRPGELRMNHVQARGTHNSYHRDPMFPGREHSEIGWDYSHRPLAHQLEHQGVRQVELDIHYNWVRDDFEVYHVGIDA